MHVGPCGASIGSSIGAPMIARACAAVTRLHGVNRLRGWCDCLRTRLS
jgi:hypothetical protein